MTPIDFAYLFNGACCWSRASTLTNDATKKQEFAQNAVGLLKEVVALNKDFVAPIADPKDPGFEHDLDPIRATPVFQEFLKTIKK